MLNLNNTDPPPPPLGVDQVRSAVDAAIRDVSLGQDCVLRCGYADGGTVWSVVIARNKAARDVGEAVAKLMDGWGEK